jgi:hypothetical protein
VTFDGIATVSVFAWERARESFTHNLAKYGG